MSSVRSLAAKTELAGGRIAVIAGSGLLPETIVEALIASGIQPLVIMIEGEADPGLSKYDHHVFRLEHAGRIFEYLKRQGVSELVFAGGIERRPRLIDIRFSLGLLPVIPRLAKALAMGDDGFLRRIVEFMETKGIRIVGAHEIVPDILADRGPMTRKRPSKKDWGNIRQAVDAARLLGAVDVGQGVVAVGGRVVAVESAEGTANMLARVAELRQTGRISATQTGVLVKCSKPGQELRVDMPAIGPDTVAQAGLANLSGIAVEAEKTLILGHRQTISKADELDLFLFGFEHDGEK